MRSLKRHTQTRKPYFNKFQALRFILSRSAVDCFLVLNDFEEIHEYNLEINEMTIEISASKSLTWIKV
ncbi:hypothetical protein BpHYR1_003462 [Brachionus plicatilis]|uniref:Uncharacterized protein n=1 Tax=Brachionus plicatilis TaxID=10195 RepID=A0A3M7TAQ8_BRAPC|nr:hypothetical protein BpHYR1_003462 [Brachionus plicatilis]